MAAIPTRLFLMGHSAGAYNAVELALDRRWLGAVGPGPDAGTVAAWSAWPGPTTSCRCRATELKTIFGREIDRPETQPINHVDGQNPPLFLGVDLGDKVVDPGNTTRLAAKVRAARRAVEVKDYKGLSHALADRAPSPRR